MEKNKAEGDNSAKQGVECRKLKFETDYTTSGSETIRCIGPEVGLGLEFPRFPIRPV